MCRVRGARPHSKLGLLRDQSIKIATKFSGRWLPFCRHLSYNGGFRSGAGSSEVKWADRDSSYYFIFAIIEKSFS